MRLCILIVVIAAHIVLLALLPTAFRSTSRPAASKSQLVFIKTSTPKESAPPLTPPAVIRATDRETLETPSAEMPPPPVTPMVPPIDWSREAAISAARQIEADERARRDAGMFAGIPRALTEQGLRPVPEFGWNHAAIHRIEPVDGGGFLIWINDRCAIFVGVLAMPFCKWGKIPPRGDLFEHMRDAPRAGDWKDQP